MGGFVADLLMVVWSDCGARAGAKCGIMRALLRWRWRGTQINEWINVDGSSLVGLLGPFHLRGWSIHFCFWIMQEIIPFSFEGAPVRCVTLPNGEGGFVGKDVAERLGYEDPTTAIRSHCRGVQILHPIPDAIGRLQSTRILTEPDVLRLIVSSKLPAAERFERWVFEEVLPSVRKTGSYTTTQADTPDPVRNKLSLLEMALKSGLIGQPVAEREALRAIGIEPPTPPAQPAAPATTHAVAAPPSGPKKWDLSKFPPVLHDDKLVSLAELARRSGWRQDALSAAFVHNGVLTRPQNGRSRITLWGSRSGEQPGSAPAKWWLNAWLKFLADKRV